MSGYRLTFTVGARAVDARHAEEIGAAVRAYLEAHPNIRGVNWVSPVVKAERIATGRLRDATLDDAETLLGWRNDPVTRANSRSSVVVGRDEHRAWLAATLADPARRLFVFVRDDEPVGTARVDFEDGSVAEVSLTVAPSRRGEGIGRLIVRAVTDWAVGRGARRVRAEIKPGNVASLRVFTGAGYGRGEVRDGLVVLWFDARMIAR